MRIGLRCFSCINQNKRQLALQREDPIESASPTLSTSSGNQNSAMCLLDDKEKLLDKINSNSARSFSYRDLAIATKNFRDSHLLGEGGFGKVYKGRLENGQVVAVKRLNLEGFQGNQEFIIEVLMLSLLHHPNLVTLIGYCAEGDQRLLVYEYMSKGTLSDHLYDVEHVTDVLDWRTRVKIAAGASRGLEHLHCKANPPVIYRDLKSANILLDDEFNTKLSDFGLAKLGPVGDKSHVSTRVMGTYGYCAPEYALSGKLTLKSDIYSFGVVLLELVTGKKAYDFTRPHGTQSLVAWSQPLLKDKKRYINLVDPRLRGRFSARSARHMIAVTAMCLHEDPSQRPPISEIVAALEFLASEADSPHTTNPNTPHRS